MKLPKHKIELYKEKDGIGREWYVVACITYKSFFWGLIQAPQKKWLGVRNGFDVLLPKREDANRFNRPVGHTMLLKEDVEQCKRRAEKALLSEHTWKLMRTFTIIKIKDL